MQSGLHMEELSSSLQKLLQQAHKGFAYEMMALEMLLQRDKKENRVAGQRPIIDSVARLMQLYMMGVQVLESVSDTRYSYFQEKIQSLLKVRRVLEEMWRASTGGKQMTVQMKKELDRQEGKERKDEMDMKLIMTERVAQPYELMLKAEDQLKVFENRVQDSLHMQQQAIAERIRLRKMRSDAGSCDKFLINSNNPSPKKVFEDIPNEPLQQSSNNIIRKNNSKDPPKKNLVNIRRTFGEEFLDFQFLPERRRRASEELDKDCTRK